MEWRRCAEARVIGDTAVAVAVAVAVGALVHPYGQVNGLVARGVRSFFRLCMSAGKTVE